VVSGGFASYGRGTSSIPSSVPVIRSRGPRSAIVGRLSLGWPIRSVSIVPYGSFFLSKAQVCCNLSLLFYFVPMDYVRTLYSNAWRKINFGSSTYSCGLLNFNWLWSCLSLRRLIGVEVPDGITSGVTSWHFGDSQPRLLLFWDLVCPDYGLVLPHFGHLRIAPFDSISFQVWASTLLSRLLLSYLVCLSTTSLVDWLHRLLYSLFLKQLSRTLHMHSSRLGPFLLRFWICVTLSVSWPYGIWIKQFMSLCFIYLIWLVNVIWYSECIEHFLSNCNLCSVRVAASHYGVYGPCPMALEWQHRMPESAHEGPGQCRGVAPCLMFIIPQRGDL